MRPSEPPYQAARRSLTALLLGGLSAGALAFACAGRTTAPPTAMPEGSEAAAVEETAQIEATPEVSGSQSAIDGLEDQEDATALAEPLPPSLPATLRVGLATDLTRVEIGCCPAILEHRGQAVETVSPVVVTPAAGSVRLPIYRLQVAALHDEGQAAGLARRLEARLGEPAESVFDAGTGLYRVRVGRHTDRAQAEAMQGRLAVEGIGDSWVVSEPGELGEPALSVSVNGKSHRLAGRWLRLRAQDEAGLLVLGRRYRGGILVFLNDRASLNVINVLPLEEYLRGVVPREMGPAIYDNLEALKAQAVAARTYTIGSLGEFEEEGYDICATPRCQVYGGILDEHPLSDRAVAQTAGEVVTFDGELIDSLYTSTCGGHTENVDVVFPQKSHQYLRGVPCVEAGVDRLAGGLDRGTSFPGGLMRRLLPEKGSTEAERLSYRLRSLARLAGLPLADDRLSSLDRREVQRFLASTFDLALDARLFSSPHDVPYLLDHPPDDWSDADLRLAAYLAKSGLLFGELAQPLSKAEAERMLFQLALFLHLLEERETRYLSLSDGVLRARSDGIEERWRLQDPVATFQSRDGEVVATSLALLPGDRLDIYLHGAEPLALVHRVSSHGAAFDRFSRKSSWTRFRSDSQLTALVDQRYPGLGFRSLEVLERGVSGRVGRVRLQGDGGRSVEIEGLPIRWTLDIPDTWFTVKRLRPVDQEAGWLFSGRGWGHGVGLCQVGSYGMGLRGHDYRGILEHYYSGVEIERLDASPVEVAEGR